MRSYISFLITLVLFSSILTTSGCKSDAEIQAEQQAVQQARYRDAITTALHEDALTGKDETSGHVSSMRSISLTDCPPEFREAYMKHIHAWEEVVAVRNAKTEVDAQEDAAAVGGGLATLFGSDATPWSDHLAAEEELKKYLAIANSDIRSTWQDIETIASRYGARIPN